MRSHADRLAVGLDVARASLGRFGRSRPRTGCDAAAAARARPGRCRGAAAPGRRRPADADLERPGQARPGRSRRCRGPPLPRGRPGRPAATRWKAAEPADPQGRRQEGRPARQGRPRPQDGRRARAPSDRRHAQRRDRLAQGPGGRHADGRDRARRVRRPARRPGRRLARTLPRRPGRGPARRRPASRSSTAPTRKTSRRRRPTRRAAPGSPTSSTSRAARGPRVVLDDRPRTSPVRSRRGRRPGPPAPVRRRPGRASRSTSPAAGLDVWRPAVAVDGDGWVVVAWSENRDGNWDLYRRTLSIPRRRLVRAEAAHRPTRSDTDVVLATAPDGTVWMAWQAWRDGQADILLAPSTDNGHADTASATRRPTSGRPRIAIDQGGRVHVAYDSYEAGNYDVAAPHPSARRHARLDRSPWPDSDDSRRGRAWRSTPADASGSPTRSGRELGQGRREPARGQGVHPLPRQPPSGSAASTATRARRARPGRGRPEPLHVMNSFPRLAVDRSGRIWLAFRHRQEAIWGNNAVLVAGGVWVEYVTALAGEDVGTPRGSSPGATACSTTARRWSSPATVPLLVVYSTDGRLRREVEFTPELSRRYWAQSGTPGGPGRLQRRPPDRGADADLEGSGRRAGPSAASSPRREGAMHRRSIPTRPADVARMRDYRIEAGGKTYRLLRGDFHRHTEISQDGGSDGAARRHVALRDRRRPARLDRRRRPRQRRRQGIHLVARPEDDRPVPEPRPSSRCSPTSGASPTPAATAT